MNGLCSMLVLLFFPMVASAQFNLPQFLDTATGSGGIRQFIRTADLDNDGFLEVIVGADISNTVRVYTNNENLNFSEPITVPGQWLQLVDIEKGDLDSNGFADLISLDRQANALYWNPNNNGVLGAPVIIDSELDVTFGRILYAEFTGDDIQDIIVLLHHDMVLYEAHGDGTFSAGVSLIPAEEQTEFYDAAYGDFNGDGFMDFTITSAGFQVYLNNGTGNFAFDAAVGNGISFAICSADFNSDGLSDVIMKTSQLLSFQNASSGISGAASIFDLGNENFKSLMPADLDGDGDLDLLTQTDQINKVVWYANDGNGNFGTQQLLHAQSAIGSFNAVHAADLDNDGDLEPIWTASNGFVAFHENNSPLGVRNISMPSLLLYPNPATETLIVSTNLERGNVGIYNPLGQCVGVGSVQAGWVAIDVAKLPAGHYFVKIDFGGGSFRKAFIKKG